MAIDSNEKHIAQCKDDQWVTDKRLLEVLLEKVSHYFLEENLISKCFLFFRSAALFFV